MSGEVVGALMGAISASIVGALAFWATFRQGTKSLEAATRQAEASLNAAREQGRATIEAAERQAAASLKANQAQLQTALEQVAMSARHAQEQERWRLRRDTYAAFATAYSEWDKVMTEWDMWNPSSGDPQPKEKHLTKYSELLHLFEVIKLEGPHHLVQPIRNVLTLCSHRSRNRAFLYSPREKSPEVIEEVKAAIEKWDQITHHEIGEVYGLMYSVLHGDGE